MYRKIFLTFLTLLHFAVSEKVYEYIMLDKIDENNFYELVVHNETDTSQSDLSWLIYFCTSWSGPCMRAEPAIELFSHLHGHEINIG